MSNSYSRDDGDDEIGNARPSRLGKDHHSAQNGGPSRRATRNPISAMLDDDNHDDDDGLSIGRPGPGQNALAPVFSQHNVPVVRPPIAILREAWANERAAPVLLAWQGDAVDSVCSQIEEQVTILDSLSADAATGEEEHVRLALVELDVERARWLLRSYLRCRLDKIEQNATFVVQDTYTRDNLSELERGYAVKYAQICSQLFHSAVLDFLPEKMRTLDDRAASGSSGRGDMVTRPDLEAPVFVRCIEECGTFRFPGDPSDVAFEKGSIHLVRYRTIQHLITPRKIELL